MCGFEAGTGATRRYGFDMTGRGGAKLSDYWSEGMRSMHGVHVHGFPNAFHVQLWHDVVANVPHNLTDSAKTVAAVVSHMASNGFDEAEVTREAEDAWMELLRPNPIMTSFLATCTPGYYNNEGHFDGQQFPLHKGRDLEIGCNAVIGQRDSTGSSILTRMLRWCRPIARGSFRQGRCRTR
jgi:hypothetical protein